MSTDALRDAIIAALRTVQDPELPVNLYDLGLIYDLQVDDAGAVAVRMTLTTPNCPVAESMPEMVRAAVAAVEGVGSVAIELVWEPAWTSDMMSDDAKLQLEMMGIAWTDTRSGGGASFTGLSVGRSDRDRRPRSG